MEKVSQRYVLACKMLNPVQRLRFRIRPFGYHITSASIITRVIATPFLLPLLTRVFTIVCPFLAFFIHLALAGLALLLSLWALLILWFKTTSTSSQAAMFNFETKDFHRLLVFWVQTTGKTSSQVWKKLATKFEQAQISHKPSQVAGQTRHKHPQAKNSRWM